MFDRFFGHDIIKIPLSFYDPVRMFDNGLTSALYFIIVFDPYLEASKAQTFTGETPSKSTGKARKEALFAQVSVLQNGQFASDSSF